MRKIYLLVFTLLIINICSNGLAQTVRPICKYEYYAFIGGIESKEDLRSIESFIDEKKEVRFFMADRFPVTYFLLLSDEIISLDLFRSWLHGSEYSSVYFGMGPEAMEAAIMAGRKNQKTN